MVLRRQSRDHDLQTPVQVATFRRVGRLERRRFTHPFGRETFGGVPPSSAGNRPPRRRAPATAGHCSHCFPARRYIPRPRCWNARIALSEWARRSSMAIPAGSNSSPSGTKAKPHRVPDLQGRSRSRDHRRRLSQRRAQRPLLGGERGDRSPPRRLRARRPAPARRPSPTRRLRPKYRPHRGKQSSNS